MEFRKCPACQASVLDDDAQECPFCGASMSGKPSAATKPSSPARRPDQGQTAQSKPAGATPASAKSGPATPLKSTKPSASRTSARGTVEQTPEDHDPFDINTSAISQATPVLPRPTKGRMIRIVCPMCETPGFISAKMQGRDVKCCNPDCMVPVFTAPKPKSSEPEETLAKPAGLSPKTLIIATVACVGLLIGLLYAFVFNGQRGATNGAGPPITPVQANNTGPTRDPGRDLITKDPGVGGPQRLPLPEIQKQSLQGIVDLARSRDENRNRAYSRRLAAEAYVVAGDVTKAREQIDLLTQVGSQVPFYQVEPLIMILWQQLQEGQTEPARKTLELAQQAGERMPVAGHATLDASVALAAGEAALGQQSAALERLADMDVELSRAQVAALSQMVFDLKTYDLDQATNTTALGMTSNPLFVAVAVRLISQGQVDQAIEWASSASDVAVREDSLSALALAAARQSSTIGEASALEKIRGKLGEQTPAGQARIHAGIAAALLQEGRRSEAEAELALASAALEQISPLPPMPAPTMRQIYQSRGARNAGLADMAPVRSAVLAALQVAQLRHQLGDPDGAWATLLNAWRFSPAMGPPFRDLSALNEDATTKQDVTQERLARELGLQTRDRKERAFREYRRQLTEFLEVAEQRYALERQLLKVAMRWGLLREVGAFIQNPAQVPHAEGQPYLESDLVSALSQYIAASPRSDELRALDESLPKGSVHRDDVARLVLQSEALLREGKYREAGGWLAQVTGANDQIRDQQALQLACRMVRDGKLTELLDFVQSLQDEVLGEDCLKMAGALSVQCGLAPDLFNVHAKEGLNATEKIALLRGLVEGIQSQSAMSPQGDDTTTTAESGVAGRRTE